VGANFLYEHLCVRDGAHPGEWWERPCSREQRVRTGHYAHPVRIDRDEQKRSGPARLDGMIKALPGDRDRRASRREADGRSRRRKVMPRRSFLLPPIIIEAKEIRSLVWIGHGCDGRRGNRPSASSYRDTGPRTAVFAPEVIIPPSRSAEPPGDPRHDERNGDRSGSPNQDSVTRGGALSAMMPEYRRPHRNFIALTCLSCMRHRQHWSTSCRVHPSLRSVRAAVRRQH
jgi:hypothetical protein